MRLSSAGAVFGIACDGPHALNGLAQAASPPGCLHRRRRQQRRVPGDDARPPCVDDDRHHASHLYRACSSWVSCRDVHNPGLRAASRSSRRYIVRTVVPRFFARVIEDGREDEPPVDLSGAFQKGDTILCEVDWLDSTITPAHWLSEAIRRIQSSG